MLLSYHFILFQTLFNTKLLCSSTIVNVTTIRIVLFFYHCDASNSTTIMNATLAKRNHELSHAFNTKCESILPKPLIVNHTQHKSKITSKIRVFVMVVSLFVLAIFMSLFRFGWCDLGLLLCDLEFVDSFLVHMVTRFRAFILANLWYVLMAIVVHGGS